MTDDFIDLLIGAISDCMAPFCLGGPGLSRKTLKQARAAAGQVFALAVRGNIAIPGKDGDCWAKELRQEVTSLWQLGYKLLDPDLYGSDIEELHRERDKLLDSLLTRSEELDLLRGFDVRSQSPPAQPPADVPATSEAPARAMTTKPKKSTERGEGRTKLIAALTRHHQYADRGCLNLEPVGVNRLARRAEVSPSTASAFFKKEFKGHPKYKRLCQDASSLVVALKQLNNEYPPWLLYDARRPPGEDDRDDDRDDE
jgi:hypothetical protein